MKQLRKLTAVILLIAVLALTMVSAATEGSLANFDKENDYRSGIFKDVSTKDWFSANVAAVYEYGLMIGTAEEQFSPYANLTLAEVITIAARAHELYYTGEDNFQERGVWYTVYAEYAEVNGIIDNVRAYGDLDKAATRAQVAEILARVLPDEAMQEVNEVKDDSIPDVKSTDDKAASIYKLYRAGILNGNDEFGTFRPASAVTRAETAAIATRLVDEGLRLEVSLVEKPDKTIEKTYTTTEEIIYHFLRDEMGMTPVGACAIMGNIAQECSYNYNLTSGPSYGLIQWAGGRKTSLINWCSRNGYDYKSLLGQLNFLKYEMSDSYYKPYIDQMNALPNTQDSLNRATDIFLTYVERAGVRVLEKRVRYATEAWERYGSVDSGN